MYKEKLNIFISSYTGELDPKLRLQPCRNNPDLVVVFAILNENKQYWIDYNNINQFLLDNRCGYYQDLHSNLDTFKRIENIILKLNNEEK